MVQMHQSLHTTQKAGETVFIHMVACHSYKFHFLVLLDLKLVEFFPL